MQNEIKYISLLKIYMKTLLYQLKILIRLNSKNFKKILKDLNLFINNNKKIQLKNKKQLKQIINFIQENKKTRY
jgi:hypothetical protein